MIAVLVSAHLGYARHNRPWLDRWHTRAVRLQRPTRLNGSTRVNLHRSTEHSSGILVASARIRAWIHPRGTRKSDTGLDGLNRGTRVRLRHAGHCKAGKVVRPGQCGQRWRKVRAALAWTLARVRKASAVARLRRYGREGQEPVDRSGEHSTGKRWNVWRTQGQNCSCRHKGRCTRTDAVGTRPGTPRARGRVSTVSK